MCLKDIPNMLKLSGYVHIASLLVCELYQACVISKITLHTFAGHVAATCHIYGSVVRQTSP